AGPERQLIHGVCVEYMAHIPNTVCPFTWLASHIFSHQRVPVAATVGAIVNLMRPHVVRREQKPVRERTFHGDRKSIVVAVVFVAAPAHLPKSRVRTRTGN